MMVLYFFTLIFFMFVSVILCATILMQESKSSGLGASFGGEASESLFGTSTAYVLKRFTAWAALLFFALCILLSLWTNALGKSKTSIPEFTMEHIEP